MAVEYTEEEIEQARLDAINDRGGMDEISEFHTHEALHTASVIVGLIDDELLSHVAVLNNPQWYRRAHRAFDELFNLYQEIGLDHL